MKRVRELAAANLSYRLKYGPFATDTPAGGPLPTPLSSPQQKLLALLRTLTPAHLYALLALAALGRRPWRNQPDLVDLYLRARNAATQAQAIAYLLDYEDLGKHLGRALAELAERRVKVDQMLGVKIEIFGPGKLPNPLAASSPVADYPPCGAKEED